MFSLFWKSSVHIIRFFKEKNYILKINKHLQYKFEKQLSIKYVFLHASPPIMIKFIVKPTTYGRTQYNNIFIIEAKLLFYCNRLFSNLYRYQETSYYNITIRYSINISPYAREGIIKVSTTFSRNEDRYPLEFCWRL